MAKGRQALPGDQGMSAVRRIPQRPDKGRPNDPDFPSDLELLAMVVDAECRAYRDDIGFHYDSRGLDHYSMAIERLRDLGELDPVDDEEVEVFAANGGRGTTRRVRTGFVKGLNLRADRPKYDPEPAVRAAQAERALAEAHQMQMERDAALARVQELEARGLLPAEPDSAMLDPETPKEA